MSISTYLNNFILIIIIIFVGIDVFFFPYEMYTWCVMTSIVVDSVKAPILGNRNCIKLMIYNFIM